MMEERKTVFDYISGLFATYGIIVVIFAVLDLAVGKEAAGYSTFFAYGNNALGVNTLLQLLLLSVIISVAANLLLSDRWIRRMPMIARNILFFLTITVAIVLFVIVFAWFPLHDPKAWAGFLISFTLCSALAVVISRLRERAENRKMDRALELYRNQREE